MKKLIISLLLIVMMAVPTFATDTITYVGDGRTLGVVDVPVEQRDFPVNDLIYRYMPIGYMLNDRYPIEPSDILNVHCKRLVGPLTRVNARLCKYAGGYNDIYVTWVQNPYATEYEIEYKFGNNEWKGVGVLRERKSVVLENLVGGVKYQIRVIPIFKGKDVYYRTDYGAKIMTVQTLKKATKPAIKKAEKVNIKWNKITGADGYQISRTINKGETYIAWTTKLNYANLKNVGVRWYKVRAYKVVDGVKVFAPWSESVRY